MRTIDADKLVVFQLDDIAVFFCKKLCYLCKYLFQVKAGEKNLRFFSYFIS